MRELHDSRRLLKAIGYSLLATLVFTGLMWALWRGYAALAQAHPDFVTRRANSCLRVGVGTWRAASA